MNNKLDVFEILNVNNKKNQEHQNAPDFNFLNVRELMTQLEKETEQKSVVVQVPAKKPQAPQPKSAPARPAPKPNPAAPQPKSAPVKRPAAQPTLTVKPASINIMTSELKPEPAPVKLTPEQTLDPALAKPAPKPVPAPQPQPKPVPAPQPKPVPAPKPAPAPKPSPAPKPVPAPKPKPVPSPAEPAPQPKNKKSFAKTIIKFVMLAAAIALILTFAIGFPKVSVNSMDPMISSGDRVAISKAAKSFKCGDIIVFKSSTGEKLTARIVAVKGDVVNINNSGGLYINNELQNEENIHGVTVITDTAVSYPVIVDEDTYFVLGDNRTDSIDSRNSDVGLVDQKDIIGKVIFCFKKI